MPTFAPSSIRYPFPQFRILIKVTIQFACVAILLGLPLRICGQTTAATLSGTITDQKGALVPNVQVTITNEDTGVSVGAKTNGAGIYSVPGLNPGRYRVLVLREGFKQVDVRDLTLNVQDVVSRNFTLEVGGTSETIQVNGSGLNINTTDGSVSTVVTSEMVANMPLNGRSFQDLILLTPGVVTQTSQASQSGYGLGQVGEFSVNGQRSESNYYTVDGVSANVGATAGINMVTGAGPSGSLAASTALGTTQALVSVDDLQEFRVQSSTYSAEYGRNPGGQFAFDTKSGTNQWHGTAYDYLRNGAFDAPDWFSDYFGTPEPALRQNDFGGTLGGPVEIPGLFNGKGKTFFFVSYEGLRLSQPQAALATYVPDAALRSAAPAPLNQALNAFPLPNGPDLGGGIAEYIGSWSNPSSINSTSIRLDHVVNEKLRLFFRFSDTPSLSLARVTSLGTPSMDESTAYTSRSYTAGFSSVFTNRLSNQFRLNYSSNQTTGATAIDSLGGNTPVNLTQLSGISPGGEPELIFFLGAYQLFLLQNPQSATQRQWNFVDTVDLSFGRHHFRLGIDYRRLTPIVFPTSPDQLYLYESVSSVAANSALTRVVARVPAYPLYTNFSTFAQDEWRASQRLTLSLGLRWEINPAPGVTQGLNAYTVQGSSANTWEAAPQGTPLWHTTWINFAPRLGAAYILRDSKGWETVVRAGGGVFFDTGQQLGSLGFDGIGFSAATGFSVEPFPSSIASPTIVNPPTAPYNGTPFFFAPHLQLPYTLEWNASIEQALGNSQALTVTYVGSRAARLLKEDEISTPNNPNTGTFVFIENGLTSDYDALQVQFQRRLSRGLSALASYTWSHCIDYGSQDYALVYQRGNCDFDVRHNLSTAFSYDLPYTGHGSFVNAVLHHWGLDDRLTARTAFPVTLNGNQTFDPVTGDLYNTGLNIVPGQPIYLFGSNCVSTLLGLGDLSPGQECPGGRAVNPNAFTAPTSGLGNAPRNFVRGFDAVQMDLAVRRDFPIYERLKLQFRAETFNIFNHPNFGAINPDFGQATFGQATATLANSLGILSPIYQQGGPRSMQFALKLVF
jgi:hypothetical protein